MVNRYFLKTLLCSSTRSSAQHVLGDYATAKFPAGTFSKAMTQLKQAKTVLGVLLLYYFFMHELLPLYRQASSTT